jgi:hypothetical protein
MMTSTVQAMHTLNHQMGARLEYMERNQYENMSLFKANIEATDERKLMHDMVLEEQGRKKEIVQKLVEVAMPLVMGFVAQYMAKQGLVPAMDDSVPPPPPAPPGAGS